MRNFVEFGLQNLSNLLEFEKGVYFKKGINYEKLREKNNDELYNILKKQGIKPQAPYNLYEF